MSFFFCTLNLSNGKIFHTNNMAIFFYFLEYLRKRQRVTCIPKRQTGEVHCSARSQDPTGETKPEVFQGSFKSMPNLGVYYRCGQTETLEGCQK